MFGSYSIISPDNVWALWAVCAVCATAAIYLEHKFVWAAKMSGCILALIFAIVLSNIGVIPTDSPVWDAVWSYVVPLSIPLLLMKCDIKKIGRASGRILIIFLIGSVGTILGALLGYVTLGDYIPEAAGVSGIFTGTYIGGSLNLAALSHSFGISEDVVSAAVVADNLLMVLYFFVLITIPTMNFFKKRYSNSQDKVAIKNENGKIDSKYWKAREISIKDIGVCIALAFTIVAVSQAICGFFSDIIPTASIPGQVFNTLLGNQYFWITTISVLCATLRPGFFGNIGGSNEIGTYLIHMFFFVIGAPASIPLIVRNSPILLAFAAIIVIVNMLFCLIFGKVFKFGIDEIVLASNANIGGPTTAAAMAISKGWVDMVGPVMLIGTFGYVIGTYCGILVGTLLGL